MAPSTILIRAGAVFVLAVCNGFILRGQDYMEDLRGEANPIPLGSGQSDLFLRFNTGDESIKLGFFRLWDLDNGVIAKNDNALSAPQCSKVLERWRNTRLRGEEERIDLCDCDSTSCDAACQTARAKWHEDERLGLPHGKFDLSSCYKAIPTTGTFHEFGGGLYVKSAASDGVAAVLSSGDLSIGSRFSGYLVYKHSKIVKDDFKHAWWLVPSVAYGESSFDLATTSASGGYQYSDTILKATDFGLSFVLTRFVGKTSGFRPNQIFYAASISLGQPNDYASLTKVKTQQFTTRTDTINGEVTTTQTAVQDQKTYGLGTVNKFEETRVRLNVAYIPENWGRRFALNLYPSLNLREDEDARIDIGFSINLLKKDDRALAIGGLTFEFVDVTNTGNSDVPFFTRCLTIGLNAGLSIDGILKKG